MLSESAEPSIDEPDESLINPPVMPDSHVTAPVGSDVTALPNGTISFDCPSSGNPPPIVSWFRNGEEVIAKGRAKIHANGTFTIQLLEPRDSARYTCRVENVAGSDNLTSHLTVKGLFLKIISCVSSVRPRPHDSGYFLIRESTTI